MVTRNSISSMQWMPGPLPHGDSTEETVATPALLAANAAPLTPGTSLGSASGLAVSGAEARMPLVALLSRTSTTDPGRTHKVSPLSALVIVTPLLEQLRGLGDAVGDAAAGEGAAVGDGEAVGGEAANGDGDADDAFLDGDAVLDGDVVLDAEMVLDGDVVPDGEACADAGAPGLAAIAESSAGAAGRCPHPVSIKAIAATPASFATRICISPPVSVVR
jgi:hypothetical protein